jgi:hypothetical protein
LHTERVYAEPVDCARTEKEKKRSRKKKWHELDELQFATVGVRRRGFGGMDALNMKLYMLQSSYSRL